MHGLNLALLVFAAFGAGAFVALLMRAMIEDAAQRRLGRETVEAAQRDNTYYAIFDQGGAPLQLGYIDGGEFTWPSGA